MNKPLYTLFPLASLKLLYIAVICHFRLKLGGDFNLFYVFNFKINTNIYVGYII